MTSFFVGVAVGAIFTFIIMRALQKRRASSDGGRSGGPGSTAEH